MATPTTTARHRNPHRDFAVTVVQRLRDAGFEALWAGGCVRDALMGREPKDYDVATTATPDDVIELFGRRRTIPVGANFGVVIVTCSDRAAGPVEVATFRSDGPYSDGRRPDSVRFCSPEQDAARRDFTINGMFFDPLAGRLVDYVGGEADLKRGLVRAIGDPDARFDEDKLRMMRAVRFAATLGFDLDPDTERSIVRWHDSLHVVSIERVNAELHRMLAHPARAKGIALLHRTRLLEVIFPAPSADAAIPSFTHATEFNRLLGILDRLTIDRFEPSLLLLLMSSGSLSKDLGVWLRHEAARLKLSNAERDTLCWLHRALSELDGIADKPMHVIKPLLAHPDHRLVLDMADAVAATDGTSPDSSDFCREFLAARSENDLNPPPLISGHDVLQAGIPPGRRVSEILHRLRREQLDEIIVDRSAALSRLDALIRAEPSAPLPDSKTQR